MSTFLVHPWTSHRVAAGYTQLQVARIFNVSRHYIIRLEQALFAEPPPGTCDRLGELYKVDPEALLKSYHEYQYNTRKIAVDKWDNFELLYNYKGETHPLVHWRETQSLSRIAFCKGFCLHQDMVRAYELNKQRHVPQELEFVCEEFGWDLEPLVGAVATWRITWR